MFALTIIHIAYRFKFNNTSLIAAYTLAALPLIFITSFKNITVGTDTASYVYFYDKIKTYSAFLKIIDDQGEAGFWFLTYIGHVFTDDYFIVFLFTSLIVTCCYFYSLKLSNLKTLSLFTLLSIGPYYFQLNGNRQAITIAIFSISIFFILKKQPVKYVISILIGFFFHKSILICLPLYFIFRNEVKPKKIGLIIFLFLLFIIFFQSFINMASSLDDRYSSYGDQQDSHGGIVVSSFNVLLFFWFFLCRIANKNTLGNRTYDILLSLYLLGALISILSIVLKIDPSGFLRMSVYFIQMNIFLIPMSIMSYKDNNTRYIITFFAIILMTGYFYLTTTTFSQLAPYKFNPIVEVVNES